MARSNHPDQRSRIEWLAVLVVLLPGVLLYGVRCYLSWVDSTQSPSILFVIVCFLCLVIVALALGVGMLVYAVKRRHFTPLLVIGLGLVLATQIPTPVYASATEIAFRQWRQDYQAIAALVRQGALKPSVSGKSTQLPGGQANLSKMGIFIDLKPYLAIEFVPSNFYQPLVYVEKPINIQAKCNNGELIKIIKQLEDNWYVCQRDVN